MALDVNSALVRRLYKIILSKFMRGDLETFRLSTLRDMLAITDAELCQALRVLDRAGMVRIKPIEGEPIERMVEVKIAAATINLVACHSIGAGIPTQDRDKEGTESVMSDGATWVAVVTSPFPDSARSLLSVTKKTDGSSETILESEQFETRLAAWAYWDSFVERVHLPLNWTPASSEPAEVTVTLRRGMLVNVSISHMKMDIPAKRFVLRPRADRGILRQQRMVQLRKIPHERQAFLEWLARQCQRWLDKPDSRGAAA